MAKRVLIMHDGFSKVCLFCFCTSIQVRGAVCGTHTKAARRRTRPPQILRHQPKVPYMRPRGTVPSCTCVPIVRSNYFPITHVSFFVNMGGAKHAKGFYPHHVCALCALCKPTGRWPTVLPRVASLLPNFLNEGGVAHKCLFSSAFQPLHFCNELSV